MMLETSSRIDSLHEDADAMKTSLTSVLGDRDGETFTDRKFSVDIPTHETKIGLDSSKDFPTDSKVMFGSND